MSEVNLYDWLKSNDVVEWIKPLIQQAGWKWREADGKIEAQIKPCVADTPWHHVKHDHRLKCGLWHQIMFDLVCPRLPVHQRFVPSKCQNCWKVVVRPKTLVQLFALRDLQKAMDRPSKCGIERRDSVFGLYGGYFYNVGLPEGKECFNLVRDAVSSDKFLGPDVQVFLKRACTEYELEHGDSDKWQITEEQLHIEALIERWVVVDDTEVRQPEKMIHHVWKKWIEFAYACGDETYAQFTGGKPLYPPYKTYDHLTDEEVQQAFG